jgi:1-deoxyxylulose-5-phosphate synthase
LTRPAGEETHRSETDDFGKTLYDAGDARTLDAVAALATERGAPMAQVALAWLLAKPGVTAPIIGASKPRHLTDALAALDLTLSPDEVARLEAPYVPHPVRGHD